MNKKGILKNVTAEAATERPAHTHARITIKFP